ncbi:MAG: hypothetical protein PHU64_06250 [Candidatus Omnitrophica bacterium]|nr:hypothetical protein [Candidatus Omnitrophota bacterium]MDD5430066.1 hypothetical protein [Candidatus Omnitrophota bacterium]
MKFFSANKYTPGALGILLAWIIILSNAVVLLSHISLYLFLKIEPVYYWLGMLSATSYASVWLWALNPYSLIGITASSIVWTALAVICAVGILLRSNLSRKVFMYMCVVNLLAIILLFILPAISESAGKAVLLSHSLSFLVTAGYMLYWSRIKFSGTGNKGI